MQQTAEKIAALLGSKEIGLIKSVLEEGFGTLTEVANKKDKLVGVKITMPMLRDPVVMVYSVLTSAEKVIADLYAGTDLYSGIDSKKTVEKAIERWMNKKRDLENISDERLLEALDDPFS